MDESTDDGDKLQADQVKLVRLRQEYARFSEAADLPQQHARMETAGFDWKKGKAAESVAKNSIANKEERGIINKERSMANGYAKCEGYISA